MDRNWKNKIANGDQKYRSPTNTSEITINFIKHVKNEVKTTWP